MVPVAVSGLGRSCRGDAGVSGDRCLGQAGRDPGPGRRQRRRQEHHAAHAAGLLRPDAVDGRVPGLDMRRAGRRICARAASMPQRTALYFQPVEPRAARRHDVDQLLPRLNRDVVGRR